MIDYSIFYQESYQDPDSLPSYDLFISAFNSSDRVKNVFDKIDATRKVWLIHPEYYYTDIEIPNENDVVTPTIEEKDEVSQVNLLINKLGDINNLNICIDITGFMRHVLIFLIVKLKSKNIKSFTAVYSEPDSYSKDEQTEFSTTTSDSVRTIASISADVESNYKNHLIINVGYDHKIISQVTSHLDNATIHPLFSFPSLSADMYQQSASRAALSGEVTKKDEWISNRKFSPANNPFATAQVISDLVKDIDNTNDRKNNFYLSPLSTKAQTLGFAIYWALEGLERDISILLPECLTYSRETSKGIKRLWLYKVELF
ncbi:hypothetical protein KPE82_08145 [Acinetobacter baumannii]|uniref:hypothetical protein n=1 Tax=Acinetobacter baumannii TaxID=470 RepID=UPI001C0E6072|nr:hypothetical protein [Acinetobacter baumannii]MBU3081573.1 hypothetical protein [Acinetobacter baumannii]MBU3095579.1 hypothetical protein [Acinetobacter baumannii]